MSTAEKIEELLTYSRILYERKLLHSTGGNTSVREGDAVWISQLGELSQLLVVTLETVLSKG